MNMPNILPVSDLRNYHEVIKMSVRRDGIKKGMVGLD